MLTKEEAYNIISDLNDDAHSMAWDSWEAADELDESEDEEDWGRAEEMREEASEEQAGYFRVDFQNLPQDQQDAIWKYALEDEDFAEDLKAWYGFEEFDEMISELEGES